MKVLKDHVHTKCSLSHCDVHPALLMSSSVKNAACDRWVGEM